MANLPNRMKSVFSLPINSFNISLFILLIISALFTEYWLGIIARIQVGDDFFIYYHSFIKAISGENPYLPYEIGNSFVYHPFVLSLLGLLSWHKMILLSFIIWVISSIVAWIIVIRLTIYLVQSYKESEGVSNKKIYIWYFTTIFIAFAPFIETVHIGQINVFVILAILLAFYYSESDKPFTSGLFLAVAIAMKTSPFILIFYFLSLRNYKLVLSSLLFLFLFTIIPMVQFSTQILSDFLLVISKLSLEIQPTPYNQSILGVSSRILSKLGFNDYESLLLILHKILLVLVLGIVLIPNLFKKPSKFLRIWQFALVLIIMTIFSSMIWYHHSLFLIFPIILLLINSKTYYTIIGITIFFLIQIERIFEHWIFNIAAPVILGHFILFTFILVLYLSYSLKNSKNELVEHNIR